MMAPFPSMSWGDSARHLESLGYSTLFVPDHFHQGLGPIAAMAMAAAATTTLRVAPMVLAVDFRHPAVLARELATIDVLSHGRLEVGLGAGYNPLDFSRTGIRHDPPGMRVDRLIEYVHVLRGLFSEGEFNFEGEHFRIEQLDGSPTPITTGGPPIILAGGGRRLLTFAAQHADVIGVNPSLPAAPTPDTARDAMPDAIDRKFEWIRDAAGDRFDAIEFTAWTGVALLSDDASAVETALAKRFPGLAGFDLGDSPIVLAGAVGEIVDRLEARRERWGYSYTVLPSSRAEEFAPIVQQLSGR